MEIKGKVHCFFEQSGTFKNEFIKLGIPAEDYDIQDNFGQTDHTDDLFAAIETAYEGGASLFDNITPDDLIMAFFPCIYFSDMSEILHTWGAYPGKTAKFATDQILKRSRNRQEFYELVVKLLAVATTFMLSNNERTIYPFIIEFLSSESDCPHNVSISAFSRLISSSIS